MFRKAQPGVERGSFPALSKRSSRGKIVELSTERTTTTAEQKEDGEERKEGGTGEGGLDAHLPRCNRTMNGSSQHRPAHQTKSEKILEYSGYSLCQSDDGVTNGTTLWLGGQILSAYLPTLRMGPGKAIELGSGIGLSACDISFNGFRPSPLL